MRQALTTAAEIAGGLLITVGAWLMYPPAGFVVAGAGLLAVGFLEGDGEQ